MAVLARAICGLVLDHCAARAAQLASVVRYDLDVLGRLSISLTFLFPIFLISTLKIQTKKYFSSWIHSLIPSLRASKYSTHPPYQGSLPLFPNFFSVILECLACNLKTTFLATLCELVPLSLGYQKSVWSYEFLFPHTSISLLHRYKPRVYAFTFKKDSVSLSVCQLRMSLTFLTLLVW